ncbi:MAG TPA: CPBP family intramembrane glutamic endopeptidase, partial [Candidatus Saccharimonadales bacterium]|nr:CPBP family intramembrane glutamic endopeptidase [Candidatus Saccharimonadales bacterium]
AIQFLPGFNAAEPQEVGFDNLNRQYEYLLAFATLVIIAPIAEEVLFRGYLYGKLRKSVPIWAAMIAVSLLFGALHMQWNDGFLAGLNVGIDVFVLSIVMCSLREVTGSIWAGILLHMLKNGLAFYFLFINPVLLNTIGG